MRKIFSFTFFLFGFISISVAQQKPLPEFFIKKTGKSTVIINWANNFGDECIQLNIQRSTDSLKNFRTIFSTPAPQLPTNGYSDKNVPEGKLYYRIFYMLAGGAYYFTLSKNPNDEAKETLVNTNEKDTSTDFLPDSKPEVKSNPSSIGVTKPLMVSKNKWGNIVIKLNTQDSYSYKMDIYNLTGDKILFTINHFDNPLLILQKSSFLRVGIYKYVIYQNDKDVEKGNFDITK